MGNNRLTNKVIRSHFYQLTIILLLLLLTACTAETGGQINPSATLPGLATIQVTVEPETRLELPKPVGQIEVFSAPTAAVAETATSLPQPTPLPDIPGKACMKAPAIASQRIMRNKNWPRPKAPDGAKGNS